MKQLVDKMMLSGAMVWPVLEGGKGIGISTGITAGSFAKAGAVGTISATNADYYDNSGNIVRYNFPLKMTRREKYTKLLEYSIAGGVDQIKVAHDIACNNGRIHLNVLWEAGGTKHILDSILSNVKGLVHGITCCAGLPYQLAEVATKHNVYYYPIISSVRAFKVLWKRSYNKLSNLLGGVVYEDPWLAGGHNGLSNSEDPLFPEDPYNRLLDLRSFMNEANLKHIPIIIAGGVWNISSFSHYINNEKIGKVAFKFGTRPLLTKESPISWEWKQRLCSVKEGEVLLHRYSPTGFYSSALKNKFLQDLQDRSERQINISKKKTEKFPCEVASGNGVSVFFVSLEDYERALSYINAGFSMLMKTPSGTVVFETKEKAQSIREDQINCMGCLHACRFSSWNDSTENNSTGLFPDPRSFCIQKTLQDVAHGGDIDNNLLFSGHNAYRFATDAMYSNGYIPTIHELVQGILKGE